MLYQERKKLFLLENSHW